MSRSSTLPNGNKQKECVNNTFNNERGQITDLIHQISSPLSAAMLLLESNEHNLDLKQREAFNCLSAVKDILQSARNEIEKVKVKVSFNPIRELKLCLDILSPIARKAGVDLILSTDEKSQLTGDPIKFQQIILNLIKNAIEAYDLQNISKLKKIVRVDVSLDGSQLIIRITDHGIGIEAARLKDIFEPFYTTKTSVNNMGMGLSIVRKYLVQDFEGSLKVTSTNRLGTVFELSFYI